MMSWNYRIFRHKAGPPTNEEYYQLHECYYDADLKPEGWTENPSAPFGETPEELIRDLERMLSDARHNQNDILDYDREGT